MPSLLNASEYLHIERNLTNVLHSVEETKHTLNLFNSTLLNAILLNSKPEDTDDDLPNSHFDIDFNTRSQFSTEADGIQFLQQETLSSLLEKNCLADFALYNALYVAPLAAENDEKKIPDDVVENLPWLVKKKLKSERNPNRITEPADHKQTSPELMLETLESSKSFSTTI